MTLCFQLLAFIAITLTCIHQGSYAIERPIWTWECQEGRCEKLQLNSEDTPTSLDACKLLCGPHSMLWPRPSGDLELGSSLLPINPNSITIEGNGAGKELGPIVAALLREAGKIFRDQLLNLNSGRGYIKQGGGSLVVEVSIEDQNASSFHSDTNESYELSISEAENAQVKALITAPTFFGARHGLETLSQLVIYNDVMEELQIINKVKITDAPHFPYRGILLDTARNYMSVASIKRTIDGMAANKLNSFHWHITDSHSFPFQSESYPLLSRYGAYSPQRVYSGVDISSVVEYARVRGVRVIPEFDAPAHVGEGWQWVRPEATVCFKAEPWKDYCVEPPCGQLNPTSDIVYEILFGIYKDMFKLFDSDIFHMGGDEVNFNCWKSSKQIREWMDKHGLNQTHKDYVKLWDIFQTKALAKVVEANGGKDIPIVLWTSGLTDKAHVDQYLDKNTYIIQIWTTGKDALIGELVKKGYRIIFSNYDALYFDCGFGAWVGEGNNWCSPYIGWQKVYMNDPYKILTDLGVNSSEGSEARSLVLGSEATLWSEQADESSVDGRLWPRAAAMAERMWTNPQSGWKDAEIRIVNHRERLVNRGIQPEALEPRWCHQNEGYCYA